MFQRKPDPRSDFDREALPHMQALFGAAMRLSRREDEAADLVQETMLRAFRFWNTFMPGTYCKAWLFRILTNTFRNRYREREREHEILDEAESSDVNMERFTANGGQAIDAENALFAGMISVEVDRALRALPEEFRLAVVLADLQDFSYKEIADIMECPAGTVMSRLFRGRKMLQTMLMDYAIENGILSKAQADESNDESKPIRLDAYRNQRANKSTP
ncbi:MAG: sigma-70 family RNA polymerase sigma factor [Deltaproteobacteria bacterium]|nr:sigma-70 family RNA polymerase sigma factor [Deltaproteobacteria bacterium]